MKTKLQKMIDVENIVLDDLFGGKTYNKLGYYCSGRRENRDKGERIIEFRLVGKPEIDIVIRTNDKS